MKNKIKNLFKNKEIEIESNVEKMNFNLISERIAETANKLNGLSAMRERHEDTVTSVGDIFCLNINKNFINNNKDIFKKLELYKYHMEEYLACKGELDRSYDKLCSYIEYFEGYNDVEKMFKSLGGYNEDCTVLERNYLFYLIVDRFDRFYGLHSHNEHKNYKLYITNKDAIEATLHVLELKFGIDKKFIENLFSYVDKVEAKINKVYDLEKTLEEKESEIIKLKEENYPSNGFIKELRDRHFINECVKEIRNKYEHCNKISINNLTGATFYIEYSIKDNVVMEQINDIQRCEKYKNEGRKLIDICLNYGMGINDNIFDFVDNDIDK
tara:strand:+ start:38 stop:1018 length:981 start_codon:yes stop_codon:yes gene_type:complete